MFDLRSSSVHSSKLLPSVRPDALARQGRLGSASDFPGMKLSSPHASWKCLSKPDSLKRMTQSRITRDGLLESFVLR